MTREIGRIIVSVILLGIVGLLYRIGFCSTEVAVQLAATNAASVILTAEVTYWLKPS